MPVDPLGFALVVALLVVAIALVSVTFYVIHKICKHSDLSEEKVKALTNMMEKLYKIINIF